MSENNTNKNTNPKEKNTTPAPTEPKKEKYKKRTTDEIVSALQAKIDYHQRCIAQLEQKKAAALMPSKGKQVKEAIQNALAAGLSMEEITARLNPNTNNAPTLI